MKSRYDLAIEYPEPEKLWPRCNPQHPGSYVLAGWEPMTAILAELDGMYWKVRITPRAYGSMASISYAVKVRYDQKFLRSYTGMRYASIMIGRAMDVVLQSDSRPVVLLRADGTIGCQRGRPSISWSWPVSHLDYYINKGTIPYMDWKLPIQGRPVITTPLGEVRNLLPHKSTHGGWVRGKDPVKGKRYPIHHTPLTQEVEPAGRRYDPVTDKIVDIIANDDPEAVWNPDTESFDHPNELSI
jgi:hypothetical protein